MKMKEFEYPSKGGGRIHAYRWEPADAPVAAVQIIHGIAEFIERYDAFAEYLNTLGFLVVATALVFTFNRELVALFIRNETVVALGGSFLISACTVKLPGAEKSRNILKFKRRF